MHFDRKFEGRHEKRLPIVIVMDLSDPEHQQDNGGEKAYTDNVSPHGACVASKRSWQPGEEVEVSSPTIGLTTRGKVVYCRQVKNGRYFVGVNFPESPIRWSNFTHSVLQ